MNVLFHLIFMGLEAEKPHNGLIYADKASLNPPKVPRYGRNITGLRGTKLANYGLFWCLSTTSPHCTSWRRGPGEGYSGSVVHYLGQCHLPHANKWHSVCPCMTMWFLSAYSPFFEYMWGWCTTQRITVLWPYPEGCRFKSCNNQSINFTTTKWSDPNCSRGIRSCLIPFVLQLFIILHRSLQYAVCYRFSSLLGSGCLITGQMTRCLSWSWWMFRKLSGKDKRYMDVFPSALEEQAPSVMLKIVCGQIIKTKWSKFQIHFCSKTD